MQWLRSIFTDDQWDADGVLIATIGAVVFVCWMQYQHPENFDPEKVGQGIAYILGGGGLGYGVKRYGEKSGTSVDDPK
jgi:hypothetical protein